jgi:hypothetical protein
MMEDRMATGLASFSGSQFVGIPTLVDVEFLPLLEKVNQFARGSGLQIHVTNAARKHGVSLGNTVVPPASRSNHLVGHAIDMNPKLDGNLFNSQALAKRNFRKLPKPVRDFIDAVRATKPLRWGGDFGAEDPVHIDDGLNVRDRAAWDAKFPVIQADLNNLTRPNAAPGAPRVLMLDRPFLEGPDVRALQERLVALGFEMIPDGQFGPMTDLAVTEFQKQQGLEPDGIVGPGTRKALGLDA